jgi:hypothetical protein
MTATADELVPLIPSGDFVTGSIAPDGSISGNCWGLDMELAGVGMSVPRTWVGCACNT